VSIVPSARTCAQIPQVSMQWLWEPYIALGRLTVLEGEPRSGKSLVAADLAARLSRGEELPNSKRTNAPAASVFVCPEDDPAVILRPRFSAAGANLDRIIVPAWQEPPSLPKSVPALRQIVEQSAAVLLVIDPLQALLPRTGARREEQVRAAVMPLAAAATETGCAVLLLSRAAPAAHLRAGGNATGLDLALTGLMLALHPEQPDLTVLTTTKNPSGLPPPALGFDFLPGSNPGVLNWSGVVDLRAEELSASRTRVASRAPRDRALAFLSRELQNGPVPVAMLQERARRRGICWRTVERAKQDMNLRAEYISRTIGWLWALRPEQDVNEPGGRLDRSTVLTLINTLTDDLGTTRVDTNPASSAVRTPVNEQVQDSHNSLISPPHQPTVADE
jgi:hypothetical protein